jgi:hypothetical protein
MRFSKVYLKYLRYKLDLTDIIAFLFIQLKAIFKNIKYCFLIFIIFRTRQNIVIELLMSVVTEYYQDASRILFFVMQICSFIIKILPLNQINK